MLLRSMDEETGYHDSLHRFIAENKDGEVNGRTMRPMRHLLDRVAGCQTAS